MLLYRGMYGCKNPGGNLYNYLPPPSPPYNQNLVRNLKFGMLSTHTYVASENEPFSAKALLISKFSAFFLQKISIFWQNNKIKVLQLMKMQVF